MRPTRAGHVADRSPAAICVPAEDLAGELQAAHSVRARGQLHAARRHMEDVCSARWIEHVRPLEEARERLAVPAVADEAKAGVRRNVARDAAHVAAPAGKREDYRVQSHERNSLVPHVRFRSEDPGTRDGSARWLR
jgi:hypothetical protein